MRSVVLKRQHVLGDFAHGVRVGWLERSVFRNRPVAALVNISRADYQDAWGKAVREAGLKNVELPTNIVLKGIPWCRQRSPGGCLCCQMIDLFWLYLADQFLNSVRIFQVNLMALFNGAGVGLAQCGAVNLNIAKIGNEILYQMPARKPGRACDENSHQ